MFNTRGICTTIKVSSKHFFYHRFKNILLKTYTIIAIIVLLIPIIMLLIEKSYIQESNNLIPNKESTYELKNSIVKEQNGQILNLQSFIWSNEQGYIYTTLEGEAQNPIVEGTILINNREIPASTYDLSNGDNYWRLSQSFKISIDYNQDYNIIYKIKQPDEKEVSFDLNLVKAENGIDYKKIGPNNIKEGIAIIGIINEKGNTLDVKLGSVVEGKESQVTCYGNEYRIDEYDSGIILKDAKGTTVKAKEIYSGDEKNHFEFDTTDLVKPYSLIVPKVTLGVNNTQNNDEIIKLKLPKEDSKEINKNVKLSASNYIGMDKNNLVKLVDINKLGDNCYEISIDFPQNKNNKIKISTVGVDSVTSKFQPNKDFNGYGEILDEENILKKIIIEPEYKDNNIIRFTVHPKYYIIEGNWRLEVD